MKPIMMPRRIVQSGRQYINIDFSEEDLQELMDFEQKHWTFVTNKGEEIDLYLFKTE